MEEYFTPYPTCVEVPEGYWVSSHDVEYVVED
jgi:hypothetical protein